mgnify:CR=1 FL=1
MSVTEAKQKFLAAKKAVSDCQSSIQTLQAKVDQLQDSLPGLSRAVEDVEKAKTAALDAFALNSNKQAEAALKAARQAHEDAQKKLSETHELIEAVGRTLKRQEGEFTRLNNLCELSKRECWESIADEIRSRIPEGVISDIQRLVVSSMQCSRTKQFVLSELFPNLNPSEYQTRRDEMLEKYNIE